NHRSNMDYVLMTYLAADRSALSYAVGEWARIWPLSGFIRAIGANFNRRKSRTPLYRKVLERYVQLAIEGGVAQGIYPEGGLSLDGKLAPPKLGLLKYISEGARETGTPVVFVPVALNYDRVLEDTILINAASEGQRRFRSSVFKGLGFVVNQVWLKLTGRYERFGCVAVRFGDPLALNTCPDKSVEDLSALLMDRIKEALPVLPVPFVCQQLLKSEILTEDELIQTAEMQLGAQVGNVASFVRGGIEILLRRKVIASTENGYLIEPDKVQLAEFYGNSIPISDG
ncbi:MAG: 1-acyl-sn-glycerol-3-phosphate acyltransferase, partial [Pseudomonadota bacterium]|nr:1-acyl-sn-glycerol-3-phosphate acyltransferase [Pseudomonadota bacterium]